MKQLKFLLFFLVVFFITGELRAAKLPVRECANDAAFLRVIFRTDKDGKILAEVADNYLHGTVTCETPKEKAELFGSLLVCKGGWMYNMKKKEDGSLVINVGRLHKKGKPIVAAMVRSGIYTGLPIALSCE